MKETISTPNAPAAAGPYSQAVKTDNLLFCSGQIALDPVSGVLAGNDIKAQTEQVMQNISQAALPAVVLLPPPCPKEPWWKLK